MITPSNLGDVGHAIQLALAPAFLLTSIAGMLSVMTGRLARIIDRGRGLAETLRHWKASLLSERVWSRVASWPVPRLHRARYRPC